MTKPETRSLLILGTGRFAEELFLLASETPGYEVAGFVENQDRSKCSRHLCDRPVHWIGEIRELSGDHLAIGGIGTTKRRGFIEAVRDLGFEFATLMHPSAQVLGPPNLRTGCIVNLGATVASNVTVGEHVIINRGCLIGHHSRIGSYCTVGPGTNVAASVTIGEGTYLGMSSVIRDHITVGDGAIVGAGAVVVADVPDRVQVMGVPAKITKENVEGL